MIENLDLNRLVPNSIKKDNEIQNIISTIDKEVDLVNSAVDRLSIYSAIDILPIDIVQVLAWQFNVASEDKGWLLTATDEEKRNLVKNSIRLHRTKGTKYALEEALRTVGFDGVVEEWFEYGGRPYHFRIKITNYKQVDEYKIKRLKGLIKEYKNARSYLEDFAIEVEISSKVPKFGIGLYSPVKVILYPIISSIVKVENNIPNFGIGLYSPVKITLLPYIEHRHRLESDSPTLGLGVYSPVKVNLLPS